MDMLRPFTSARLSSSNLHRGREPTAAAQGSGRRPAESTEAAAARASNKASTTAVWPAHDATTKGRPADSTLARKVKRVRVMAAAFCPCRSSAASTITWRSSTSIALTSALWEQSNCTDSSDPARAAYAKGVRPRASQVLTETRASKSRLSKSLSPCSAQQCNAVRPSFLSLLLRSACELSNMRVALRLPAWAAARSASPRSSEDGEPISSRHWQISGRSFEAASPRGVIPSLLCKQMSARCCKSVSIIARLPIPPTMAFSNAVLPCGSRASTATRPASNAWTTFVWPLFAANTNARSRGRSGGRSFKTSSRLSTAVRALLSWPSSSLSDTSSLSKRE
mmetsp:Transcript_10621/g.20569  ORF Transcript_10621/g.20569 Transcript_10621/m.20569 type:complete len:338 (-) Transcript_10621:67-1080(-)